MLTRRPSSRLHARQDESRELSFAPTLVRRDVDKLLDDLKRLKAEEQSLRREIAGLNSVVDKLAAASAEVDHEVLKLCREASLSGNFTLWQTLGAPALVRIIGKQGTYQVFAGETASCGGLGLVGETGDRSFCGNNGLAPGRVGYAPHCCGAGHRSRNRRGTGSLAFGALHLFVGFVRILRCVAKNFLRVGSV